MAQVFQMTTEQLHQLLESVRTASTSAAAVTGGTAEATKKSKGSFSTCQHKFGGQRVHTVVEEFITQIITFKELEDITDEDALKGISLLFFGDASIWWQGVKKEAKTWNEAIGLLREHFSPAKPSYQIYMEIFETKQDDNVAIDTFVCNKRALLAQLPDDRHDEETELDFVYGLLNIKYRKHIARLDVKSFRELLEKGRVIEHNNQEDAEASKGPVRGAKGVKRCTYCNFRGHTTEECRKRKSSDDPSDQRANKQPRTN